MRDSVSVAVHIFFAIFKIERKFEQLLETVQVKGKIFRSLLLRPIKDILSVKRGACDNFARKNISK